MSSHKMNSIVNRKKNQLDSNEHEEASEETTKMLPESIKHRNDKDATGSESSVPLSSDTNNSNDDPTTPSNHSDHDTTTTNSTSDQIASSTTTTTSTTVTSDWYIEGVRRVRYVQVQRKMRYLTGMAAIGGFLFGYDTGKKNYVVVSFCCVLFLFMRDYT